MFLNHLAKMKELVVAQQQNTAHSTPFGGQRTDYYRKKNLNTQLLILKPVSVGVKKGTEFIKKDEEEEEGTVIKDSLVRGCYIIKLDINS